MLGNEGLAIEDEKLERDFQVIKKAHAKVVETVLGRPRTRKKPWISEESWNLVDPWKKSNKKILEHDQNESRCK